MHTEEEPLGPEHAAGHHHPTAAEIAERIRAAAIEAEYETGHREETEEEARRGVIIRIIRIIGGFMLIGAGVAALVLPGPGWLLIILGLGLLPFTWAERTVQLIRRRIPGVPEDGRIPTLTLIAMGGIVVVFAGLSFFFGGAVTDWIGGLWGHPDKLLT
ncbi:MAG: PGPGW domain-containing protein [Microthrixaceae bacterium]